LTDDYGSDCATIGADHDNGSILGCDALLLAPGTSRERFLMLSDGSLRDSDQEFGRDVSDPVAGYELDEVAPM
jgi:hypothetical protein